MRPVPRRSAVLLLSAIACQAADPTAPIPQLLALTRAESDWEAAKLRNYSFNSRILCFCRDGFTDTKRVTVRDGVVTAVVDRATGRVEPLTWRQPVDSLFALIRREVRDLPERLEVTYDPRLGFPRRITYGVREVDGGGIIEVDSLRADP